MDQAQVLQTEPFDTPSLADEAPVYELAQIDLDQIRAIYEHVAPHVQTVTERSTGEITEEWIAQQVADGLLQFWVVTDGNRVAAIVGTSLDRTAAGKKKCTIRFVAGHHSDKWLHLLEQIESWAAYEGCTHVRMYARKGWAKRLPEYKMTQIVMEREI